MAGMRALGRVTNPVPVASGVALDFSQCSGIEFVATNSGTGAASVAFTASKTYGSGYVAMSTANGFGNEPTWYSGTTSATLAWTSNTAVWSSGTLTTNGASSQNYVAVVDILSSQMADGYRWIKATGANATIVAIPYDLTVQRTPANLKIISS